MIPRFAKRQASGRVTFGSVFSGSVFSVVCLTIALSGFAFCTLADAAVVYKKNNSKPIYGFVVRKSDTEIVMNQEVDGRSVEVTIPMSEVDEFIETVSEKRLSELSPAIPSSYRDYAEELMVKKLDPEAKQMAIRLFLIAASLDESSLRSSSLRSLVGLARNDKEREKFVSLNIRFGEPDSINTDSKLVATAQLDADTRSELVKGLRLVRTGKGQEALKVFNSPSAKTALAKVVFLITENEIRLAANANKLGDRILQRLLRAEQFLRFPTQAETSSDSRSWSNILRKQTKPVTRVTIENATEFDPNRKMFRNGRWNIN